MTSPQINDPATTEREMSRDECLSLLRTHALGRVAISEGALPLILPVNYALDTASIVFRTRQGGLLDRSCRNTIVAFEVDHYDDATQTGWSVLIVGVANALYAGDWLRAVELGLTSAAAGDGAVFVKIVPGTMTGRCIEAGAGRVGDGSAREPRQSQDATTETG